MWLTEYDSAESYCASGTGDSSSESLSISERYELWLKRGKEIAADQSTSQWKVGDWVVEGQDEFEDIFQPLGSSDRHLLIQKKPEGGCVAAKMPNFWKEISAETGLTVSSLKMYGYVARSFPERKKRFHQLTFSHHMVAASSEHKYEYLAKCLDVPKGTRPRSIMWLEAYIKQQEQTQDGQAAIVKSACVYFPVADGTYARLKQITKYLHTNIPDFVEKALTVALDTLMEEHAKKISLEQLGFWDGKWPFEPAQPRQKKPKLRSSAPTWQRTPAYRKKVAEGMREAWKREKGQRRGTVQIRRIAHNGRVG